MEELKHAIELVEGAKPVMKRPYRLSEVQKATRYMNRSVKRCLRVGSNPLNRHGAQRSLMVPKKDGSWRMCVDYRELNSLTIQDAYSDAQDRRPPSQAGRSEVLLEIGPAGRISSDLDGASGSSQRRHSGLQSLLMDIVLFEWKVMPFGLKNAPPTFQRYMTLVMAECVSCCLVYMDDLLVYSVTPEQHLLDLKKVFHTLQNAKLKVKKEKCVFGTTSVEFLGHVISGGRIEMEPNKRTLF